MSRVQLWSCGGGRQSVLMLGLIKAGELPKPDAACMVDTNRERSSTWRYVNAVIRPELELLGIPLTVIDRSKYATVDLWGGADGDTVLIPAFTAKSEHGGDGKFAEYCSGEWKRDVVTRWAASQEGWKPRGVDTWIGITQEERHRRRGPKRKWIQPVYPLLDVCPSHVSRVYEFCERFGWPGPVRSCCWMCPNMGNEEWRTLRDDDPDDFAKACELDDSIRERDPALFVHKSRVPLRLADLGQPDAPGLFGGCSSGMCY
jgi:hypothetical protein